MTDVASKPYSTAAIARTAHSIATAELAASLGSLLARRSAMKSCEGCGNSYDKTFEVMIGGTTHTFDSFACAIHVLAPRCMHCGTPIIGHGIEARGQYFCCAHCARQTGVTEVSDRAPDRGAAPP